MELRDDSRLCSGEHDGQTLDVQQAALKEAGATRLFAEKQSGAKTDRAALARCIASLGSCCSAAIAARIRLAIGWEELR